MNLVLLFESDFIAENRVELFSRRFDHISRIHKPSTGDSLSVGLLNGKIGTGVITNIGLNSVQLTVSLTQPPPAPLPITLILALPRPKMLRRILQTCATMGVKELILINSFRVEKSYWQTPWLHENSVKEQFLLGLEQGRDTLLPKLTLEKRFKPFVEDRLPTICKGKHSMVAHPGNYPTCPSISNEETVMVIGPEGGFIPYEIEMLEKAGCLPVQLGERIMRVETAVPVILSKLFL